MSKPTLTILIVAKDDDRFDRTLESITSQPAESRIEILVVNGGNSKLITKRSVVRSWNIVEIIGGRDGVYQAMNIGTEKASGKWIVFLNCGDLLASNEIAGDLVRICDDAERRGSILVECSYRKSSNQQLVKPGQCRGWKLCHEDICHQAVIFKRNALIDVGLYDESFRLCADKLAILRMLRKGNAMTVDDATVIWEDGRGLCMSNLQQYRKERKMIAQQEFTRAQRVLNLIRFRFNRAFYRV